MILLSSAAFKGLIPDASIDGWVTLPSSASSPDAEHRSRVPIKHVKVGADRLEYRVHPDWDPARHVTYEGGKPRVLSSAEKKADAENLADLKKKTFTLEGPNLEKHRELAKKIAEGSKGIAKKIADSRAEKLEPPGQVHASHASIDAAARQTPYWQREGFAREHGLPMGALGKDVTDKMTAVRVDWSKVEYQPAGVGTHAENPDPAKSESIATTLARVGDASQARRNKLILSLAELPDGTKVGEWEKTTVAGDAFWRKKSKYAALPEVGDREIHEALVKHKTRQTRVEDLSDVELLARHHENKNLFAHGRGNTPEENTRWDEAVAEADRLGKEGWKRGMYLEASKAPPRSVETIKKEIDAVNQKLDRANMSGQRLGGEYTHLTRARATTREAQAGNLAKRKDSLTEELHRATEGEGIDGSYTYPISGKNGYPIWLMDRPTDADRDKYPYEVVKALARGEQVPEEQIRNAPGILEAAEKFEKRVGPGGKATADRVREALSKGRTGTIREHLDGHKERTVGKFLDPDLKKEYKLKVYWARQLGGYGWKVCEGENEEKFPGMNEGTDPIEKARARFEQYMNMRKRPGQVAPFQVIVDPLKDKDTVTKIKAVPRSVMKTFAGESKGGGGTWKEEGKTLIFTPRAVSQFAQGGHSEELKQEMQRRGYTAAYDARHHYFELEE